ncbi:glutamine-hydrolyzing GMP synthase, partial [bacterium]|nr:glutamine-hydrolyzing GMP synthase [bacterium]
MAGHQKITILDFGSQYTQLIARRIREIGVFSEIKPFDAPVSSFAEESLIGIVLSGGPASVLDDDSPQIDDSVFELGVPVLGLCYGMQLIALKFKGLLERSQTREYGRAKVRIEREEPLFSGLLKESIVWMSHGDHVERLPNGFDLSASTETLPIAAFQDTNRKIFGLQFHPEVEHTEFGAQMLHNFA